MDWLILTVIVLVCAFEEDLQVAFRRVVYGEQVKRKGTYFCPSCEEGFDRPRVKKIPPGHLFHGGSERTYSCPRCVHDFGFGRPPLYKERVDKKEKPKDKEARVDLTKKKDLSEQPNKHWTFEYYKNWYEQIDVWKRVDYRNSLVLMPYGDYLQTAHWKIMRKEAKRVCEKRCMNCGEERALHVHHKSYDRIGDPSEEIFDLKVLCNDCHDSEHVE